MSSRITVLLRSFDGGGAERVAVNLANGFVERGFEVDLVVQYRRGPYLSLVSESIEVVELGKRIRYAIPRLVSYLRTRRPRALLTVTTEPNVLGVVAWRLAGSVGRVVVTECSSLTGLERSRRIALRLVYPRADRVIAKSEQMMHEIIEYGIDASQVVAIPNPLPPELSTLGPSVRSGGDSPQYLIAVGRLVPEKDYPTLLKAFNLVRKELDIRLLILGEGPERASLESLMADLGLGDHVILGGFVSPPWAAMKDSAALVLSSRREGWPGVIVEALALGVPVVSTDCPTGPAEILDNGRFGSLVPVGDPVALANAIKKVLANPGDPEALRLRALEWSADEIVPRYLDALGLPISIAS